MTDFLIQFEQLIARCTEEFLIKHANKGLYNRAVKDMEKGLQVAFTFEADQVVCKLEDEIVCHVKADMNSHVCSCPSEKICKHIIMALLSYKQNYETKVEAKPADFSWLLTKPLGEIYDQFTEAQVEEVLFRISYAEELEIGESSFLTIKMSWQDVEVSFMEEADIRKSICSCKQKESCIHRLEAILRYRAIHQVIDDSWYQTNKHINYSLDVVQNSKEIITEIISLGLAKLPETICARLEVLAIAAHNGQLAQLEKDMRNIHGQVTLFFQRHIRFSQKAFLEKLTSTYLRTVALEKEQSQEQLRQVMGRFKSRYYTIPRLRLYALGANPWATRSSYKGITYYFYCTDDKKIYSYTDSRPVYYEGIEFHFKEQYGQRSPWGREWRMNDLSRSQLELRACKVNREQRISSSEETLLALKSRESIENVDLGDFLIHNWNERHARDQHMALFQGRQEQLAIIQVSKVNGSTYEQGTQNFIFTVNDQKGNELVMTIPYNQEWEKTIPFLEKDKKFLELRDFYIFAHVYEQHIYPISFLKGEAVTNLKLDF
ncbi:hypothetical protein B9C88_14540 [Brevibacillus laterosporus]|uniref:SWIM zinc finger family protein n=1 Tax=Brevibacillus laterosporus TaxID=1465 RepID=UPI000BCD63D7|nr:SWIM zinc finger family protein [Brevibacillus laterosporus]PCN43702.1 hypothetical protein B9C88_14540 [Brevibacillus laterosporus]